MTISQPFLAKVDNGQIVAMDANARKSAVRPHEGRIIVVTLKRFMKVRTTGKPDEDANANGYYFGVVIPYWMRKMFIDDQKEMHIILKTLYNYKGVLVGDEFVRIPVSIKGMFSAPFWEYVQKCRTGYAQEYGDEIPDPTTIVAQELMAEYHALGNARPEYE